MEVILDAAFKAVLEGEIGDYGVYASALIDFEDIHLEDCGTNNSDLLYTLGEVDEFFRIAALEAGTDMNHPSTSLSELMRN